MGFSTPQQREIQTDFWSNPGPDVGLAAAARMDVTVELRRN
jgi:hypothetical protein